ncbi:hypothetical protein GGR61_000911 [Xanthomonas arboricola]|nr:hypothetical protein [Xanthomonas sp. 3058]
MTLSDERRQRSQCLNLVRANQPPRSLHVFWNCDFVALRQTALTPTTWKRTVFSAALNPPPSRGRRRGLCLIRRGKDQRLGRACLAVIIAALRSANTGTFEEWSAGAGAGPYTTMMSCKSPPWMGSRRVLPRCPRTAPAHRIKAPANHAFLNPQPKSRRQQTGLSSINMKAPADQPSSANQLSQATRLSKHAGCGPEISPRAPVGQSPRPWPSFP